MFVDASGPALAYRDPWQASLDERLRALVRRERHIAYFYERPDAHTFRYRVANMIEALDAQPHLGASAAWFSYDDLEHGIDFVDRAHLLVICRTRYDQRIGELIARARARRIRVLYDIDDLIFDLRHAHLVGDSIKRPLHSSEEWDWWCGYIGRLGLTLQFCDGVLVTNDYLRQRVIEFAPSMAVETIPNFYNKWQHDVSMNIFRRKFDNAPQRDGKLHIGYFSGTSTHSKDFGIVVGALDRMLDVDSSVVINIVGSLDVPPRLKRHGQRIRTLALQDFINLQRLQGEVEIAIAPTLDNHFTNCKSELKFFEAALVGTIVIASPTFAFRHAIDDGINGYLAAAHQWFDKLQEAAALLSDGGAAYRDFAYRAQEQVASRYAPEHQAKFILKAISGSTMS